MSVRGGPGVKKRYTAHDNFKRLPSQTVVGGWLYNVSVNSQRLFGLAT